MYRNNRFDLIEEKCAFCQKSMMNFGKTNKKFLKHHGSSLLCYNTLMTLGNNEGYIVIPIGD